MKKMKAFTMLCLTFTSFFSYSSGLYLGLQGGYGIEENARFKRLGEEQLLIRDHDTGVGSIKAGYDLNRFFGAELRIGTANARSIMKSHASAYLKAQYPLKNDLTFYALLGGTSAFMSSDYFEETTLNSLSYGAGMRIPLSDNFGINVELMQTSSHERYNLSALQVGFDYRF